MRRFLILLLFILCFTVQVEARKFALLVGVDDYDSVHSLKCCVNDTKALKGALLKVGFLENDIHVLITGATTREMPTKKKIEDTLRTLFADAGPSDMIFIAFSGHGAQIGKNVWFCPPFVDLDDIEGTCVSITQMMEDLAKSEAKFKWVVVDACRNNPTEEGVGKSLGSKGLQAVPAPPAGIVLFQSCAAGEESQEDRVNMRGYFTKNLVAALSGEADLDHNGDLTLMEVCSWTTSQTQEQVQRIEKEKQRPYFSGSFSDFIIMRDLNLPQARKLAAEAEKAMEAENYTLALEKFDAALALCPKVEHWKRERSMVERILKVQKQHAPVSGSDSSPEPPVSGSRLRPNQAVSGSNLLPSNPQAGERAVLKYDGIEYAFRWCPPGEFMMGSPLGESDRHDDEKPHKVIITNGFWLLETEVTQGMWESVMDSNPSYFKGYCNPVETVSWNDCQDFCQKLSQKLGHQVQLPTEAQWEYACRAGTTGAYAGEINKLGWYDDESGPHPVGKKDANAWGLYDMHGNVWEWCSDWYDKGYYAESPTSDPPGPGSGSIRVCRGGSWADATEVCRSALRDCYFSILGDEVLGFRVLLVPVSED